MAITSDLRYFELQQSSSGCCTKKQKPIGPLMIFPDGRVKEMKWEDAEDARVNLMVSHVNLGLMIRHIAHEKHLDDATAATHILKATEGEDGQPEPEITMDVLTRIDRAMHEQFG